MKALYVTPGKRPGDMPQEIVIDFQYEFGPGPWTSEDPDGERAHVRRAVAAFAASLSFRGGLVRFEDECSRCLLIEKQCQCETYRGRPLHFGNDFAIIECVERSSGRTGRVDLGGRFNFICDEDIHHREQTRKNIEVAFSTMWDEDVAVRFGDEPVNPPERVDSPVSLADAVGDFAAAPRPDPPKEGQAP